MTTHQITLTDEQKKQIAGVVHRDCTLLPGANFYAAAELAIEATLAQLHRALLSASKPAAPVEKSATLDEELQEIYDGWQDSEDGITGLLRAVYDYGRSEQKRMADAAPAQSGVIAAAQSLIAADRAQALTTEHVNALENAIAIQRGEVALPAPAQSGEPVSKSVATVRVTHKGYAMELSTYVAYALTEGVHELYAAPQPAQPAKAGELMTNGGFHCPACGEVMKGPTECGSCLWEADTCGYKSAVVLDDEPGEANALVREVLREARDAQEAEQAPTPDNSGLYEMAKWAVERWNAEVKNRPLANVHRRTLDDVWRQVIRHCGADPDVLVGLSHDDLLAAAQPVAQPVKQTRALTGWQPIATAPEGKLVVVFWRDDDDQEMHDFDYLEDGIWVKHTEHYEWAYSVAPPGSKMPSERAPYTHWLDLREVPIGAQPAPGEKS